MLKNKVYLGFSAGIVATIVKDVLNHGLYGVKILKSLFAQYAAGMYVNSMNAKSFLGIQIGYFVDFGISAFLGIIFIFILEKTKPKHIIFQGLIFGSALLLIIYGGLISIGITSVSDRDPIGVVLMIFIHLIYGFVLGVFVQKFGKNTLTLQ